MTMNAGVLGEETAVGICFPIGYLIVRPFFRHFKTKAKNEKLPTFRHHEKT